jgi:hypothetical protein
LILFSLEFLLLFFFSTNLSLYSSFCKKNYYQYITFASDKLILLHILIFYPLFLYKCYWICWKRYYKGNIKNVKKIMFKCSFDSINFTTVWLA